MFEYTLIDPIIEEELKTGGRNPRDYLFLSKSKDYPWHWKIDSFDPFYVETYFDLIGTYRCIHLFKLVQLAKKAEETGHSIIFLDDPAEDLHFVTTLDEPLPNEDILPFALKKFQRRGLNFLLNNRADLVEWSTGTGKSVFACVKAHYLLECAAEVDAVIIVSKAHNRINWVRQLKDVVGLDAAFVGFYWNEDKARYVEYGKNATENREYRVSQYTNNNVLVVNYEKFRLDEEEIRAAFKGKEIYFVWDEMPTKLKNKGTQVWKATSRVVKTTSNPWHSCLSATNIENSPEDVYNCVKIMDDDALDRTLQEFRARYVGEWSRFGTSMTCPVCKGSGQYKNYKCSRCYGKGEIKLPPKVASWNGQKLPEIGMRLGRMVHKASKYNDPEIAAEFPDEIWDWQYLDISNEDAKLYDYCTNLIMKEFDKSTPGRILQLMTVLQHVVNNPATLVNSESEIAEILREKKPNALTDKYSAKLAYLKDLLTEEVDGKVVLFSSYNEFGAQMLAKYLEEWGVSYVLYEGSPQKKQEAQDRFKSDPTVKVFISSDQGSDSINLQEATTVINYDLPWKWSTLLQRVNRINRITSKSIGVETVTYINLQMANTVEDRRQTLINKKRGYQTAIFDTGIGEQSEAMTEILDNLTKDDLYWILTGKERVS